MNNAGWGSPYQDDTYNDVYFEELADPVQPRTALQQAVIDTTGTAVSLRGYTPDEIRRVGPIQAEDPDSDSDDADELRNLSNDF